MVNNKLKKKLVDHHFAAYIAFGMVALVLYVSIPADIHHKDYSNTKSTGAIATVEYNLLKIFSWEYSTHIESVNGKYSHDHIYGLPDLVILDRGHHILSVGCEWRFLNTNWVSAVRQINIDVIPEKIYLLKSLRQSKAMFFGECTVYVEELDFQELELLTEQQRKYLHLYGLI